VTVLGSAVALFAAEPTSAQNFVLTPANCPVCSQAQVDQWRSIRSQQLGVAGVDTEGAYIGLWPAEKFRGSVANAWYPQSPVKQTLCGTLEAYSFYDGGTEAFGLGGVALGDEAEADWNLHVSPSAPFGFLFDEVARRHTQTDRWRGRQIEAEITPDEGYYENPWFSKTRGESDDVVKSPLESHSLCAYGPWVGDKGHDFKPEIHPSELLWWRSGTSAYMLNMQDDSNRFDNRKDFDLDPTPPSSWREWAQFPRVARFDIAVSLSGPGAPPPIPQRGSIPRLEVRTQRLIKPVLNDAGDADNGRRHGIEYNGQVVLRVNENLSRQFDFPSGRRPSDGDIKVGFNFCRILGQGPPTPSRRDRLLGYVTLTSAVGDTDKGDFNGEGVHLLRVVRRVDAGSTNEQTILRRAPIIRGRKSPRVSARTRWIPSSIRRVTLRGQPQLVANAEVAAQPIGKARRGDRAISTGRVTSGPAARRPTLRPARAGRALRATLPVMSRTRLSIRTRSGQSATAELPAVGAVVGFNNPEPETPSTPTDPSAAAAAAGAPGKTLSGARVADRWKATVTPGYAGVRDGVAAIDEDTPIGEKLTEILTDDAKRRRSLFRSARPMPARWSFRAINAVTGQAIPVGVDRPAGPGEIAIRRSRGAGASSVINVTFPSTGIYRLTATARIRDPFGNTAKATQLLSNLVLSGSNRAEIATGVLTSLEELAGLTPGQLVAASAHVLNPSLASTDRAARTAGAVRMLANDAAEDQRINLDELDVLLRATRLFAQG